MLARFRSWWQKIKQHPLITTGIIVVLFALIAFTFAVYKFGWDWTGFTGGESKVTTTSTPNGTTIAKELQSGKTLWDWLGLLAIPVVVGLGAAWFTAKQTQASEATNKQQYKNELEIATDNQREAALQS